jgi:hypothetical protein
MMEDFDALKEQKARILQAQKEQEWLDNFWQSKAGVHIRAFLDKRGYDWREQSYETVQRNIRILADAIFNFDQPERTRAELTEVVEWQRSKEQP